MFIKTTRAKGYEYIKLVESYRESGTTKHRVLYNFGRADLIRKDESFLRIVKRLCEIAEMPLTDAVEGANPLDECGEATFYNYGYVAYRQLWKELDIEGCLQEATNCTKITFPLPDVVFLMVMQHLLEPKSKLATHADQCRYFNMNEIPLHHMYRALDCLYEQKDGIEAGLFEHNYIRMNKKVDVVFYDVTTVHFESAIADELRDFGFSKACKFNEVQVVMGMIIDSEGVPVGYELFKGNTFDGKTMVEALKNIKKRFGINKVVIVADRGINSKGNLLLIKEAGYGYVVASKVKNSAKALREKILADKGFTDIKDKEGNLSLRYKVMEHDNIFKDENNTTHKLMENIVVSYSPKRARKDAADRERLVTKAKKLLEKPETIKSSNKRGGKKYIDRVDKNKEEYALAVDKIESDSQFDGFYAIQTSEKSMTAKEVMDAYHTLWKIEESFRIMKSTLEIRPVFHWSPKRVEGHFVVCFLAFLMERKMELLLQRVGYEEYEESTSPGKIQQALNTMQLAAVTVNGEEKFIKAKCHPLAKKIFKHLRLDMPANISSKSDLVARFRFDDVPEPLQLSLYNETIA